MARSSIALLLCGLLLVAAALDPLPAGAAAPEALVLPHASTLQVIAADLDGDGVREVVRLAVGDDDATVLEAWRLAGDDWRRVANLVQVLPPARRGVRSERVHADAPLRLVAWRAEDRERLLVASQPSFELLDVGPACCLLLDEVRLEGETLRLVRVAEPAPSADALLAIDLDGDGSDELLVTRSLHVGGDVAYPLEVRLQRYVDGAFAAPEVITLPYGAGDAPFVLGDTDGVPGLEAGIMATAGGAPLLRIRVGSDGTLVMDRALLPNLWAAGAMPTSDGPLLVTSRRDGLTTWRWPAGQQPDEVARLPIADALLLGVVGTGQRPRAVTVRRDNGTLDLFDAETRWHTASRSRAAVDLAAAGTRLYAGMIPGGGPSGEPLIVHAGNLVGLLGDDPAFAPHGVRSVAPLADAVPLGVAGDGEWLLLEHDGLPGDAPRRDGGRLFSRVPMPAAWHSLVPLATVLDPTPPAAIEVAVDDGAGVHVASPGTPPERSGSIFAGAAGFGVEIVAPRGSRVRLAGPGGSGRQGMRVVPDSGRLELAVQPPAGIERLAVVVTSPSGHGAVHAWDIHLLDGPPPISASASTPFLSSSALVSGTVPPGSEVTVGGGTVVVAADGSFAAHVELPPWPTEVTVEVTDVAGNAARTAVVGIGFVDYRALPWVAVVGAVLVLAAVRLYVRTPPPGRGAPASEDATLEELEAD